MIKTTIITIGDELLIGQVIDTNSAWMAQELNKAGIKVLRRVAIGDNYEEIWKTLEEESAQADVLLITGGLGPTADDITKPLLTKYFGGKLVTDQGALDNVKYLFEQVFKRPLTERNYKQAEVPDNCKVLPNNNGTAPGMLFEKNNKIYVSMPGVPHEMQGMMTNDVIPFLQDKFILPFIRHRTLVTYGIGESDLADLVQDFEEALPPHIKLAYLPNYGMVRLRLTGMSKDKELLGSAIDKAFGTLQEKVKDYLVTNADETMPQVVARQLLERKQTLCTAESCTGGFIAHQLSALPGTSAFYEGSVVSYSYKAKEDLLEVDTHLLLEKGAVSEDVVRQMAAGALKKFGTDFTIAVSGIMGPGGGMPDKPVGTVWVCVGNKDNLVARKFHFRFDRLRNIQLTSVNALNLLRIFMKENE